MPHPRVTECPALGVFGHLHDFFPRHTPREILAMRVFDMDVYYLCKFLDSANLDSALQGLGQPIFFMIGAPFGTQTSITFTHYSTALELGFPF